MLKAVFLTEKKGVKMSPEGYPMSDGMVLFLTIFLLAMAVIWFFLPFAVFGIKSYLKRLDTAAEKANNQLDLIIERIEALEGRPANRPQD